MARRKAVSAQPRFWVLLIAVLVIIGVAIYVNFGHLLAQREESLAALERKRAQLAIENAELERKYAFAATEDYVVRMAHEKYNLIREGEIRIVGN